MSNQVDLEEVLDGYVVSAIAFDPPNKRLLMRASYRDGIEFEVSHYHYPPLITRDPVAAMNFYNNDPPPPPPELLPKVQSNPRFDGIKQVFQTDSNSAVSRQN